MFQWDNSSQLYVQRGSTIFGEANDNQSGSSVSLSASGDTLAIGAFKNDGGGGKDSGHVRVFQWNSMDYVQKGSDIDGVSAGDRFSADRAFAISLSDNGDLVVGGAPHHDISGADNVGHVRVFEWVDVKAPKVSL